MFTFDHLKKFVLFWSISHSLYVFYDFTEEFSFSMACVGLKFCTRKLCTSSYNAAKIDFQVTGIV